MTRIMKSIALYLGLVVSISAIGQTPMEETDGEPQMQEASSEPQMQEASREPQMDEASSEAPTEEASSATPMEEASGEPSTEEANSEPQMEEATGEQPMGEERSEPSMEEASGEQPMQQADDSGEGVPEAESSASSESATATDNQQSLPGLDPVMMERLAVVVSETLDIWEEAFADTAEFDAIALGKECLRGGSSDCDGFVALLVVAWKMVKEGPPLKPLTEKQIDSLNSYVARSPPRCVNEPRCLQNEASAETAPHLFTLLRDDPSLDAEGIYQKLEASYPRTPKVCLVVAVLTVYWWTHAAHKAHAEGTGPAFVEELNSWVASKKPIIFPDGFDFYAMGDPSSLEAGIDKTEIERNGKRYSLWSVGDRNEYIDQYCADWK